MSFAGGRVRCLIHFPRHVCRGCCVILPPDALTLDTRNQASWFVCLVGFCGQYWVAKLTFDEGVFSKEKKHHVSLDDGESSAVTQTGPLSRKRWRSDARATQASSPPLLSRLVRQSGRTSSVHENKFFWGPDGEPIFSPAQRVSRPGRRNCSSPDKG